MYRTGDLARWRRDNTLESPGRGDQQIKLCGFRIAVGEIEAALKSQPGIAHAAAIGDGEDEEYPGKNWLPISCLPAKYLLIHQRCAVI